jgi:hypothetical protein
LRESFAREARSAVAFQCRKLGVEIGESGIELIAMAGILGGL